MIPMFHKKELLPALCVSLCLCGAMAPSVSAVEIPELSNQEEITPYALYIRKAECTLSLNGGIATIRVSVTGQTGVVDRCQVVVTLEEKSGTTWKTIATWSDESDGGRASLSETKAVTAGKTYRAKVVATAWSGSKSETKTILSSEKKA
ncbi:hypothetical protein [Flintibacter porci]|uniref:hypothetical protein n=1 Tax=Flintibacter porci TaxID=3342383 RepID=UPI003F889D42